MRALFALAILALGFTGFTAAGAADLPAGRVAFTTPHGVSGVRAGQILIYDDQPGVHARAYWRAPWRNRHYYPVSGEKPKFGRDEDLSAGEGSAPVPAVSFYREWWTPPTIVAPDYYPEPPRANEPVKP
jgi:hypothetical protein